MRSNPQYVSIGKDVHRYHIQHKDNKGPIIKQLKTGTVKICV